MMRMRAKILIVPLLLLLLTLLFFHKVVLNPDKIIYPVPDTVNMLSSWRMLFAETFRNYTELPMWNNYETSGTPFFGNILSAMFYPLNLLFLVFPTDFVFGYKFLINIVFAGLFMYLLSRQLKLDKYSSFFSSVVYMFSGIFIGRIQIGHEPAIDIIALTPLLFLLFWKALENRSVKYGILAGIVFGFQILAGYTQFAIYAGYLIMAYFLYNIVARRWFDAKSLFSKSVLLSIVFVTAFLVSAIQLLPSFELSDHAIHAGKPISYNILTDEASSYSLSPQYTISFVLPDFFGSRADGTYWTPDQFEESTAYFGILPLMLAFLPIIFERNRYVVFFTIVAVIALLFSYGQYSPLFPLLHKIILVMDIVRNPARFLTLFVFAASILSAFGHRTLINFLRNDDKPKINLLTKMLFAFSILTAIVLVWYALNKPFVVDLAENSIKEIIIDKLSSPSPDRIGNYTLDFYSANSNAIAQRMYYHIFVDIGKLLFTFSGTAILLLLSLKSKTRLNFVSTALIALVVIDLWMFGSKYINVDSLENVYPVDDVIRFVADDYKNDNFRVLGLNRTMEPRFAVRNGIQTLDGVLPPTLEIFGKYMTAIDNKQFGGDPAEVVVRTVENPKMLDLLNVKYVLTTEMFTRDESDDNFSLVFSKEVEKLDIRKQLKFNQTVYVYENLDYMPKTFVVENFKVVKNETEALEELKRVDFDPKLYVVLEKEPSSGYQTGNYSKSFANIMLYSPNRIVVHTDMENPGFLVLSEVWYPAWRAFIYDCNDSICSSEGKETEILKTNYLFRSVQLDKGEYKVEFVYSNANVFKNLKLLN